ncbi:single-stranded DNA-binding protein [Marine Group I thaumarchaeote]|uniref:Single-stranded DNA-binding protein n=1 Tax=Marine Group I thaumarchaeote TaxID=2511932 RepID=A0A7K4NQU4_9ARCH|nr:single-stranded DNA-binding protein [Marine Group I thaumarchaeote]
MSEFEELLKKIQEQKPELTKQDIDDRIKQKIEKIGPGYLTDEGALFLIAKDLGISLKQTLKTEMSLKDIYVGAKDVSIESRVLNISPTKQFSRKDGSPFLLRTMTVYDNDSTVSVKLWDEKANLPGIEELKPGDLIKIIKAYIKSDLNGSPTINVGSGSNIESTNKESKIRAVDELTIDVSEVKENQSNLVVSGKIDGSITTLEFTNRRGEPGKGLKMRLKGNDDATKGVVIWGKDESFLPKVIPQNAKVRLLGVRTKIGNQGLEIHGNEATLIEIEGGKESEPVIVRIATMKRNDGGKTVAMGIDNKKNMVYLTDSSNMLDSISAGDVIECMPAQVFGNAVTINNNSFVRKIDDESIPQLSSLRTKISEIKSGNNYCIEAIILKEPEKREVQTKTGETILLSEMFVEDDSGQIWIKGWRKQAILLDGLSSGEIISVTAVNAKAGLEGRTELFLTPFSAVAEKN